MKLTTSKAFGLSGLALLLSAAAAPALDAPADLKDLYKRPTTVPFPIKAPYSPQLATLGKKLFFDPRLSGAKNMSCASCHNPSFGYEAPVDRAVGAANEKVGRHAPTVLNAAWVAPFFWDGRAPSLEAQAEGPITAAVEMNMHFDDLLRDLGQIGEYETWFQKLFPDTGLTKDNVLTALATYERTVVTDWAPFDRWVDGDDDAITASAKKGFELFNGKANCAACHSGWNFTDNKFHDIGLPTDDIGRGKLEPDNVMAQYAFKTPGLRNLTQRAPFGHNGSLTDLETIVRHYETGGVQRPSLSPMMIAFQLTETERQNLLDFLRSLTADKSETPVPVLPN
jgi:cytochrome c peroxidase